MIVHGGSRPRKAHAALAIFRKTSRFGSATLVNNRFEMYPRWAAAALLIGASLLMLYGVLAPPAPVPPMRPVGVSQTDGELYRAIISRLQRGEGYYKTAADEQRMRGYPLFPWVTMRPPALAALTVAVGGESNAALLLKLIAVAAALGIVLRIHLAVRALPLVAVGAGIAAVAISFPANVVLFHESWAALLIMLSLALWSEQRFEFSFACGIAAVMIRELTLPYLGVMLVLAMMRRARNESLTWAAGIVAVSVTLALHADRVDAVRRAGDLHSPGWASAGGWPFVLRMMRETTAMGLLPSWAAAVLVPLSLIGWAGWKHPMADRALFYLVGMIGAFMLVGRPNNVYWGMLLAPMLPIGLVFVPSVTNTLWRRLREGGP